MPSNSSTMVVTTQYIQFILFILLSLSFVDADDKSAMTDLINSFVTPPPSGWDPQTSYCSWRGVNCDTSQRVTSINIPNQKLNSTLPSSFNTLTQLTTLNLQNNHFSGPLPTFSNLSNLQTLFLDNNNFNSVPKGAFSGLISLQVLSISFNYDLSPWSFPVELQDSTTLTSFYASNVQMEGEIPDVFASFTGLQTLRLRYNNFNGSLPSSFNGTSIQTLWLNNGGLSGSIEVVSSMVDLTQVWLHGNKFTGQIPDLSACTEIFDLQLRDNEFTGIVPVSVLNLPKLVNVTLQNNKLQGPLPVFRTNVTNVSVGTSEGTNSYCRDTPGECDPQVSILLEIAGGFGYPVKLAESWKGNDACDSWTFVNCDVNKVIVINFAKQGFSGVISPAFGELTSLTDLLLNDNNLTGSIPQKLATLPKLKKLDVSNNDLSGKIPSFRAGVNFIDTGNKNIGKDLPVSGGGSGGSGSSSSDGGGGSEGSKVSGAMVAGVVNAVLAFIAVVMFVSYKRYMKKKMLQVKSQEELEKDLWQLAPELPLKFTYESLMAATRNFDLQNKLGVGGFGSVFKGSLRNGSNIAVKRLDSVGQGQKEFIAEVRTLGSLHHVNLIKLVGFCAEKNHRLLVYEFLGNGSLDKWIFTSKRRGSLNWEAKRKIILQIAKGLTYLHEDCQKRIAHLDVKPQNVLLDDAFNAKLSDFGLAKLIDRDQSHTMTQMRGTRGYLAPEWLGRKITERVDVYSYGVVVLEMVFERKNLDYSQREESTLLIHMVKQKVEESQLIDLLNLCSEDMQQQAEDIEKVVKLALCCLHSEPLQRPTMSMIVKVLEGALSMEAIDDNTIGILTMDENTSSDAMTLQSASILSGPR